MPVTLNDTSEFCSTLGDLQPATDRDSETEPDGNKANPLPLSDRLYPLIALCYEAISADDGWSRFASELARELSATGCAAIIFGGMGTGQTIQWAHGRPPRQSGNWLPKGFDPKPPLLPGTRPRADANADGLFLTGLISGNDRPSCAVVVVRPAGASDFSQDDSALLGELLPHIDRASQVSHTIRDSENRSGTLTEILDRLPEAIFLVDVRGSVVSNNLSARDIARENDGLSLIDDRISIALPNEQETLRALIAKAARPAMHQTHRTGGVMTMSVSRPSGRTALPIVVTPVLCRGVPDGRPEIVAAVITKDTELRGAILVPDLAIAFGLTPGETRLAGLVAGGMGLKEAAEALGITRNTIRTHMKRVYAKTGVHSQVDLVRLLSRGSIELRQLATEK